MIFKLLTFFLPWPLRRRALNKWYGFKIKKGAYIGLAWVFPRNLIMEEGAQIDHFTVAIHIDSIIMEKKTFIGR